MINLVMEFTSKGKEIKAEDCSEHIPDGYEVVGLNCSSFIDEYLFEFNNGMITDKTELTEYSVRFELIKRGA